MFKKRFGKYLVYLLPLGILIVFTLLLFGIKRKVPTSTSLPPEALITPTPTLTFPASRWATDAGVLTIETDLKAVENDLDNVDLQEIKLQPPILDLEISL